jgi:hypothetical protein
MTPATADLCATAVCAFVAVVVCCAAIVAVHRPGRTVARSVDWEAAEGEMRSGDLVCRFHACRLVQEPRVWVLWRDDFGGGLYVLGQRGLVPFRRWIQQSRLHRGCELLWRPLAGARPAEADLAPRLLESVRHLPPPASYAARLRALGLLREARPWALLNHGMAPGVRYGPATRLHGEADAAASWECEPA